MEKKENIRFIEALRCFAILAAILCHATECTFRLYGLGDAEQMNIFMSFALPTRGFAFLAYTIGRLGVPLFLLISGYLLLDRDYSKDGIIKFWKNRWLRLFLCTELWLLIFDLFLKFYRHANVSFLRIVQDLLFLNRVDIMHQWYLPMILGVYAFLPLFAIALRHIEIKHLVFPLCLVFGYLFLYPTADIVCKGLGAVGLNETMLSGFTGAIYMVYVVLGFLLKKGVFRKIASGWLFVCLALSICLCVVFQLWTCHASVGYTLWYDSPFLLIASVSLFELVSRFKTVLCYPVVKITAYYSFAIYLIHEPIRQVLETVLPAVIVNTPVTVLLIWFLVAVLSLICAFLISKIPYIGKRILYLK